MDLYHGLNFAVISNSTGEPGYRALVTLTEKPWPKLEPLLQVLPAMEDKVNGTKKESQYVIKINNRTADNVNILIVILFLNRHFSVSKQEYLSS